MPIRRYIKQKIEGVTKLWWVKVKPVVILPLALVLSACTPALVDQKMPAQGQDSRVQYVVVHYTSADLTRSLKLLTQGEVSSHYLIGDQAQPVVYQLVDENRRAWHAGDSAWQGRTWLNSSSVGIELVHPGYRELDGQRHWYPFSDAQVERLIRLLLDIKARHQLPIDAVIGHSDIAPLRKVDPGPLFPWHKLAEAGLIRWPQPEQISQARRELTELPQDAWFQERLRALGYQISVSGEWDELSQKVLSAFQMKYRPANHQGEPDLETAALLWALTETRR